jgi:hypothetical protein
MCIPLKRNQLSFPLKDWYFRGNKRLHSWLFPVRLQGRPIRRCLPSEAPKLSRPSGLPPSFALLAFKPVRPRPVSGQLCAGAPPCERLWSLYPRGPCSGPGYSVPVPLRLIDPIRPSGGTSRLRRTAVYTRCLRCACSSVPRRPTTGSELSLMVFRNLSSSETTGNFPAALTQYFTGNTGLRHGLNVSAFPSPSHSDSGEAVLFAA